MRWQMKGPLLTLLGTSLVMLSPATARAGFMPGFTGYTQMSLTSTGGAAGVQGVVNFAVLQRTSASWVTDVGAPVVPIPVLGGGVIDLTANYVYFYEIVNQTSGVSLEKFNVFSGSTPYTSAGFLFQTVFSDSTGAVGPAGNQYLGLNPGATPAGDTLDGQPTQSGVAAPGFATNLSATAPSSADLGGAGTGGFASFFFDTPRISPSGGFSTVVFLTSNAPPVYARGDIRDGGDPAVGDIPVQAPEPAGLLLQVIGIGALGGMYGWRRWRGSALPSLA